MRRVALLCAGGAVVGGAVVAAAVAEFVPQGARPQFALLVSAVLLVVAALVGAAASVVAPGLALGPFRRLASVLQQEQLDEVALAELARSPSAEVATLARAVDATRRRLQTSMAHVQRERMQMATIFEHMADGVLVLDAEERVALSNPAAARLLRQRSLDGRLVSEAVRDADIVEVARAAHTTVPVARVIELRQKAAAPRLWVQVAATRLPGDERTLLLLQDVTELRRAEAARRDFVANVSHELRTPVASLKALVETLEAGALSDPKDGPDFLRRMHVEVDGLAHMVTELLELARVEAGRLELELEPCSSENLVFEAVQRLQPYAERVGLSMSLARERAGDASVSADARRVGQVLANLLANAVKFTPPGGRVEVGTRVSGDFVEFRVSDTGVGIPPDCLSRVFERFYKTDPSRAGGGTGLGLAISKHLVRAHGGAIWAESAGEGRGATFSFTLRRTTRTEGAARRRAPPAAALPPGRRRGRPDAADAARRLRTGPRRAGPELPD